MDLGILGANGIVGGGLTMAVGAALSCQYLENGRVTLCFFGDGAMNQGGFYEGANLAAVWKLPLIYFCENNQYALSTPLSQDAAVTDLSERAAGLGFPGVRVDGNDVLAVYEVVTAAAERARAGEGPTLINAVTYRWEGHVIGESGLPWIGPSLLPQNLPVEGHGRQATQLTVPVLGAMMDHLPDQHIRHAIPVQIAEPEVPAHPESFRIDFFPQFHPGIGSD